MFKKAVAIGLIMVNMFTSTNALNVEKVYKGDGNITISQLNPELREGDMVTITLTKYGRDFVNEDELKNINSGDVVLFGETSVQADKSFVFDIMLADDATSNGKYTLYMSNDRAEKAEISHITYIDASENASAISELISQASISNEAFRSVFENKQVELGLFSKAFVDCDKEEAAKILMPSVLEMQTVPDTATVITLADKAAVAALLNKNTALNFDTYVKNIKLDEKIAKNYKKSYSNEITSLISNKNISRIDELDTMIKDAIIIAAVNNGSETEVKDVLTNFAANIGTYQTTKVTKNLITAIKSRAQQNKFIAVYAIRDFVENYTEPQNSGGAGGGTGGGGAGGGGITKPVGDTSYDGTQLIGNIKNESDEKVMVFNDLDAVLWAEPAITELYYKSIINGKGDGKFCPNDKVTRAEFVKMITVALNINLIDKEFPFTDVLENDWFFRYVRTAYHAGITTGVNETTFAPNENISRQDLCVMIVRALEKGEFIFKNTIDAKTAFNDASEISDYAVDAVDTLSKVGVVNGDKSGEFNPEDAATRAETAKIISSVLNIIQ